MGELTEREIFDCMVTNFRLAVEHCEDLARLPVSGPTYLKLREELGLLEGTCRQAAVWRQDCRWYEIGIMMAEAHKRAGTWLRGATDPDTGRKIRLSEDHRIRCFTKLADNLRGAHKIALDCRDKKTGRVGMILPDSYTPLRRPGKSGLILPPNFSPAAGNA